MKLKLCVIVSMIILAIFVVGAVNASDVLTVSDSTVDDVGDDSISSVEDVGLIYDSEYDVDNSLSVNTNENSDEYPKVTVPSLVVENKEYNITFETNDGSNDELTVYYKENGSEMDYVKLESSIVENNFASVSLSGLTIGNYTILVNYTNFEQEYSLSVVSANVGMALVDFEDGENILYKTDRIVYVHLPNYVTGNMTCIVDGEIFYQYVIFSNSIFKGFYFSSSKLEIGSHRLEIKYTSDKFKNESVDVLFNIVSEIEEDNNDYPIITVPSIVVFGDDDNITLATNDNDDGVFSVFYKECDENDYMELGSCNVENNFASIPLSKLGIGEYDILVKYADLDYYHYIRVVNDLNINIEVIDFKNDEDILYNTDREIEVILPYYATGVLSYVVDGDLIKKEFIKKTNSHWFYLNSSKLELGNHTLEIAYTSDEFNNSTVELSFNIVPALINISERFNVDSDYIDIILASDATGNVTILLNNKLYKDIMLDGKKSEFHLSLDDVVLDNYTIDVIYSGDSNYTKFVKSSSISLIYNIDIYPCSFTFDEKDKLVYIDVPYNVGDGELIVTIDGKIYDWFVMDYSILLNVSDLKGGNHEVSIKYTGDDKYYPLLVEDIIEISYGIHCPIYYSYNDGEEVYLVLPSDANGDLILDIYSLTNKRWNDSLNDYVFDLNKINSSSVHLINGVADYSLSHLPVGLYRIYYSYSGDDYLVDSGFEDVEICTNFNFDYDDIKVNESKYISVMIPVDGEVIINIFNVTYKVWDEDGGDFDYEFNQIDSIEIPLENGVANYTLSNLPIGEYKLEVSVRVDGEIVGSTRDLFNVTPGNIIIPYVISYNETAIFSIELPHNASGEFSLEVYSSDEQNNIITLKNTTFVDGKISLSLSNLNVGKYNILINYTGNYGKFSYGSNLKVSPVIYIEDNNIIFEFDNANGNLTLFIDSDEITTVPVVDGNANITLPSNLKDNNYYHILVKYNEDNINYEYNDNLYVKQNANININANVQSNSITFDFKLPIYASGSITLIIGDKKYFTPILNGKSSMTTELLSQNDKITVDYSGNLLFSNLTKTVLYSDIPKTIKNNSAAVNVNPKITGNKDITMFYQDGSVYKVRVYGTDGKIVGANKNVKFTINGKSYIIKTDKNGYASLKIIDVPKKYTIIAQYGKTKVTNRITVKQILTLKTVKVKKSAKQLILAATLSKVNGKYLKSKTITFKFNGKTYKTKTNAKGIAKVTIKKSVLNKLKVGKKINYKAVYIKDTVSKSVKIRK